MNIFSWNINGLRAIDKKGKLAEFINQKNPDIICFQEIKIDSNAIKKEDFQQKYPNYLQFYSHAAKKGYAGTAIWSKVQPSAIIRQLPKNIIAKNHLTDKFGDATSEGRVCAADFYDFWLVAVYTPNAKGSLERLDLRQQWDKAFLNFVKQLEAGELTSSDFHENELEIINSAPEKVFWQKPVIFCGDLNVAHQEIDLAKPKQNIGEHGFTNEERAGFGKMIEAGFVDIFRKNNPELTGAYTWWSHFAKSRERNVGWRIDYFLHSSTAKNISNPQIHPEITGSDHCPVSITIGEQDV